MAQGPHDDPERTELLATRSPAGGATPGEAAALPAGARLGRYRIEGLLGRGGMGEVYRAEQLEPVRRTVALKLLRAQKLDARHLAYFEVERQLLAQMRHPAIAQVFDADTTADGHPFFAMEFIAGSPITAYCDAHAMPTDARIALFIRVCEGVQHAHQKGVIHRDLKPGNLLVDEVDGRALPKIIDFGIATASTLTEGREVAGTPDYMSPEQAGGDQALVDTRSDVYALGVVLSELLTGRRPLAAGETVTDHDRTLRLPSAQLSTLSPADADQLAKAHGEPVSRMRRVLQTELDWVVAKAMRHDRNERYASAAALADDLQRFLDARPLQAVPPSRGYAMRKFAQRHRTGIAAAALIALALWRAGMRQGPTRPPASNARRQLQEHLKASADFLLRRSGQGTLLHALQRDILRAVRHRHPGFEHLDNAEQWRVLEHLTRQPSHVISQALGPLPAKRLSSADFSFSTASSSVWASLESRSICVPSSMQTS